MRIEKIGNIAEQIRRISYDKSVAINQPKEGYCPILRAHNINDSVINYEDLVFVPQELVKENQNFRVGDVLVCASSGSLHLVGKAAMLNEDFEGSFGAFCKLLRPNSKEVFYKYFRYFFETAFYKQTIIGLAAGANISNLKNEHIDNLGIPLPTIPTQKKIAEILDTADSIRQKDKALIEKYNQLTQSLFLEMFGDPVNNTKGWEVKKLKSISIKIHSGNTPKGGSNVYVSDGITFFRSQNVWRNRLDLDDVAYIDQDTHKKMSKSSLKHGDILMTKTGRFNTENSSLGRAAMFLGEDDSANINGHVYLIRLQKSIIKEFVLFILTTDEYREYIRRVCVGGIDKRQLNKDHLEEFPIIWPPIELQKKFVEKLKCIEKLKCFTLESAKKSEALFNSLLQKAFSGELVKEELTKPIKKQNLVV